MAAFTLAEICNGYQDGRQSCLEMGLHSICVAVALELSGQSNSDRSDNCSSLKVWICLCLCKLCEGNLWAKYFCITESGHTQLYPLLVDPDPKVRAAAVSG